MDKIIAANIAKDVYDAVKDDSIEGYTIIDVIANPFINFDTGIFTGFKVALLKNSEGKYVIAFAGTDSILDGITDISMFINTFKDGLADQFTQAGVTLADWIRNPEYNISSSNTTIVGHSLGGSLAQYFGATTGYETLTYNAYGVSGMDMVPSSSGDNITNYITISDPVSSLPGSEMIGNTYMLQDENDKRMVA